VKKSVKKVIKKVKPDTEKWYMGTNLENPKVRETFISVYGEEKARRMAEKQKN